MKHSYQVEVKEVGNSQAGAALQFEFSMHEDLQELVVRAQQRQIFSPDEAQAFCLGLKLFSGVMLEHRSDPLFAEFQQHFGAFMRRLKQG